MKLVAIHTIHRCVEPGQSKIDEETGRDKTVKRAKTQIVAPGTIFEADSAEAKDLKRLKAAREPTDRELKMDKIGLSISPTGGMAVVSETAPSGDAGQGDDGDDDEGTDGDPADKKTTRRKI